MIIPLLKAVQKLGRKEPPCLMVRHHLMLIGISQTLFLKNWGRPDAQIPLTRLGGFYKRQAMYLVTNSDDEPAYSIWIYWEKDRILFFIRKRLIAHFKWSAFKGEPDCLNGGIQTEDIKNPPPLIPRTLALVA